MNISKPTARMASRDGSKGKPLREEGCSQAYIHGYETALNEKACRAGLPSELVATRCEKWNRVVCPSLKGRLDGRESEANMDVGN